MGFAGIFDNEARKEAFAYLRMFQEYYHHGSVQNYLLIEEHKIEYWINQEDRC